MKTEKYLLDSNVLIHLLHGRTEVRKRIEQVGWERCCMAELSLVELYYGAECSEHPVENKQLIKEMICDMEIIPFNICIDEFCRQKARLRRMGALIEDFDIFIGTTAIVMGCILVTENVKHLSRLENVQIENWIVR